MPTQNPHVLVFDSGLGGLSVSEEIASLLPGVSLTYFGDTGFFPYGTRTAAEVETRVVDCLQRLVDKYQPDIIVLACNTASTVALPAARALIDTPIVGVVPAIKPAAEQSTSKVIGLLATPGTVEREYTSDLIYTFARDCEIISVGSSELVRLAEEKLLLGKAVDNQLGDILKPLTSHPSSAQIDTIVLACTHFPLLKSELALAFGREVTWLDSGLAIANRVSWLLSQSGIEAKGAGDYTALLGTEPPQPERLTQELHSRGFSKIQFGAI